MISGIEDQMRQKTVPASITSLPLWTLAYHCYRSNWSLLKCFVVCFPVNSVENQATQNKKCKPHAYGKRSKFWLRSVCGVLCLATETRLAITFSVLIHWTVQLFFHLLVLPWIEKRNAKKRLSQEQAQDDAGQQPEVTDTDGPPGLEGLSLPSKVPLIELKTEPEEQESKWSNSCCSLFLIFVRQFC